MYTLNFAVNIEKKICHIPFGNVEQCFCNSYVLILLKAAKLKEAHHHLSHRHNNNK
jgi:hypothetical protein